MRLHLTLAAAAAALSLGACSMMGDPAVDAAATADMTPEDRTAFVMMAGASDLFEIQSSQLAQTKAQRPEVRQFAQMLIQHHTQTTQQVTAAARAAGMNPPPPALNSMQAQMIAELQQASAANFDAVYLRQQVPAHEQALALHSNYSKNGDTPSLRTAAAGAVPIVTQHLAEARRLNR